MNKPTTVEECLEYITNFKYKSIGHPYFFIANAYNPVVKSEKWQCIWRNPEWNMPNTNFNDGDTQPKVAETPLKACHNAIDFIERNTKYFFK